MSIDTKQPVFEIITGIYLDSEYQHMPFGVSGNWTYFIPPAQILGIKRLSD